MHVMRVIVVGGGIGGLALAQGLAGRGFDVVVVEKDRDLARTGGYKLHLGRAAVLALRELLSPSLFELLLASSVGTQAFAMAVRDHRCRLLLRACDGGVGTSLDVDRVTLRLVLAQGLGGCLLPGRQVTGYRAQTDRVLVDLDDGESLVADLVVAADGAGSICTQLLAGSPTSRPTGLVGVAGRSPWHDLPASTRHLLSTEPMLAIGPGAAASSLRPTTLPADPRSRLLAVWLRRRSRSPSGA